MGLSEAACSSFASEETWPTGSLRRWHISTASVSAGFQVLHETCKHKAWYDGYPGVAAANKQQTMKSCFQNWDSWLWLSVAWRLKAQVLDSNRPPSATNLSASYWTTLIDQKSSEESQGSKDESPREEHVTRESYMLGCVVESGSIWSIQRNEKSEWAILVGTEGSSVLSTCHTQLLLCSLIAGEAMITSTTES